MISIADKTRSAGVTGAGEPRPIAGGLEIVETDTPPADAAALLASGDGLCVSGRTSGRGTTIALRAAGGQLLGVATVVPGAESSLAAFRAKSALARTSYLSDLAWKAGAERCAPLLLYAALRRARIAGASTLAAHVCDPGGVLAGIFPFSTLPGVPRLHGCPGARSHGLTAVGQRVDIAIDRAHAAWLDAGGEALDPSLYLAEVEETVKLWLSDLYGRGFFRAVVDGTLTREQFVYTASNMHQFVRWTTRLLGLAVGSSHARPLRDHYLRHLSGEVNHEILIERDLAHLGADVEYVVERMPPSPATRHFMAVQESLIAFHRDPVAFMASPLAAEGVASHQTVDFLDALENVIAGWGVRDPRKAMTFFTSHVNTDGGDDGHWEMTLSLVGRHLRTETDAARFVSTMRSSMAALTAAYDEYVQDLAVFTFEGARRQERSA
jgi:hypothetical protein